MNDTYHHFKNEYDIAVQYRERKMRNYEKISQMKSHFHFKKIYLWFRLDDVFFSEFAQILNMSFIAETICNKLCECFSA